MNATERDFRNPHPGCFERHLQRRFESPLFPKDRRNVSEEELRAAIEKDRGDQKAFLKKYGVLWADIHNLNEKSPIQEVVGCLKRTQDFLEEAASIGGELKKEAEDLQKAEDHLTEVLNTLNPGGAELLKRARALSGVKRVPFFAQSGRSDSPILQSELVPTLLSESLEAISAVGLMSREFPKFQPNEKEIVDCLDRAQHDGLDPAYAKEALDAWRGVRVGRSGL